MKRKLLTYLLLLLSPYFILAQNKTKVYFVEFKGEREITANPIKQYEGKSNNEKPITIRIYSEISFQIMEGIGGASHRGQLGDALDERGVSGAGPGAGARDRRRSPGAEGGGGGEGEAADRGAGFFDALLLVLKLQSSSVER